MRRWWRAQRLRLHLTLWHLAVMVAVLGVYAAVVYTFATRNVSDALDQQLRGDFQWAAAVVAPQTDGTFICPLCEELESNALTLAFDSGPGFDAGPWLQVWSPRGDLLYASMEALRLSVDRSRELAVRPARQDGIATTQTLQGPMRMLTRHGEICPLGTDLGMLLIGGVVCTSEILGDPDQPPVPVVIQVVRSEAPMRQELGDLLLILLLGLPLSVGVAGVGGYTLARRALAPVDHMAERARSITAERLHDRLPVQNPDDEMGRLATVFNETLGRLETSFEQMRRFTADVSHELRTPLTAIQSVGEVGLREHRNEAANRRIIGSMLEEVDRLSSLVGRLLAFSRAETDASQTVTDVVDLPRLAEEVAGHLGVLAEEKGQSMEIEAPTAVQCLGDRLVLRQALINLVHNAIKFSPAGGRVRIRVSRLGERALIEVIDSGAGVPEALRQRLFDRFYRGQPPAGDTGGAGLGLSIAKRAVEANHGHLSLESTSPAGATFRISLPRATPVARGA